MTKVTIKEQIEAIAFDTLTAEQFDFLRERALKSIRKASTKKVETKNQKENKVFLSQVLEWLAEQARPVTCGETASFLGIEGQRASAILNKASDEGILVKTEAKGSRKATWALPE